MKKMLFFVFLLLPCWLSAQSVDSVALRQVDSLIQVSRGLTGQREFDKAIEVNAAAEKLALEKFGRESAAYGSCCANRGRIFYYKGNKPEAEKWWLDAKVIREKSLGREHPHYAVSLSNLAILYEKMGQYEK
ncbi:MAG: tetratricopeptide repeat protein, partial [Saprospiraceae bacterium]|nr:tetratricopeptide repeat protein [Saprospiraceae bacterium]